MNLEYILKLCKQNRQIMLLSYGGYKFLSEGHVAVMVQGICPKWTAIFFIRHINEPDKPYFTLEFDFKNMCVRQNSGLKHCVRTPEVENFEEKWVEFVKNTAGAKKERKVA